MRFTKRELQILKTALVRADVAIDKGLFPKGAEKEEIVRIYERLNDEIKDIEFEEEKLNF